MADKKIDKKAEDRKKALETALTQIEKDFGKGAVMRLGQNTNMNVEAISTGSLSFYPNCTQYLNAEVMGCICITIPLVDSTLLETRLQ